MACFSRSAAKVTLGFSIVLLLLSVVGLVAFEALYKKILSEEIALEQGGLVTKIWEDIPLPIYEKLYFFNITNKKAFLGGSEHMAVEEVGPYTYKARWVKTNPRWNPNNTVSYRETRTYEFVPELSNGTQDDTVFTLNGPMILGATILPWYLRDGFYLYCLGEGEEIVIRKKIRELVYEGYKDPIISHVNFLVSGSPYVDGRFSWLYGKNDSDDGLFTVFTGTDDPSRTNFIDRWNGLDRLKFWKDDACNGLNGTTIETGPPMEGREVDSYTFFQTIFCRSLTFDYEKEVSHFDVTAKRFRPDPRLFANSTENPENSCFEVKRERPSGVLDVRTCQFGAPVLLSFPHFYMADPSYLDAVCGLSPDAERHGSHIDVEPITGLSIDLTVRFQVNIEVEHISHFYLFDGLKTGVLPLFWAELSLEIDRDLANFLKHSVRDPKLIAYSVIAVPFLAGWIGAIVSVVILCGSRSSDDQKPLIAKPEDGKVSPHWKGYSYSHEQNVGEEKPAWFQKSSSEDASMSINSSQLSGSTLTESAVAHVENADRK